MIVRVTIELEGENNAKQLEAVLRGLVSAIEIREPARAELDAPSQAVQIEAEKPARSSGGRKSGRKPRAKRGEGAIAQLRLLKEQGYFDQWRTAADVRRQLETVGFPSDNKGIYVALKYMTDRGALNRDQDQGSFYYHI
jgi:hypothetical protein